MRNSIRLIASVFSSVLVTAGYGVHASECRACIYAGGAPFHLDPLHQDALLALKKFEEQDAKLAETFSDKTLQPANRLLTAVLMDEKLSQWLYPWLQDHLAKDSSIEEKHELKRQAKRRLKESGVLVGFDVDNRFYEESVHATLVLEGGDVVWHTPAHTNISKSAGKWYWEVKFKPGSDQLPHIGALGVVSLDDEFDNEERVLGISGEAFASLIGGEIVRFALDMNSRRLFVAVDGNWVIGDPLNGKSGRAIPGVSEIAAGVVPVEPNKYPYQPDVFEFNFGRSPFVYAPPKGYLSFDSSLQSGSGSKSFAVAGRTHAREQQSVETLFLQAVNRKPEFDRETKAIFEKDVLAWSNFRNAACTYAAAYKRKGQKMDSACMRDFTRQLAVSASLLESLAARVLPYDVNELPPINQVEKPKLHAVLLGESENYIQPFKTYIRVDEAESPVVLFLKSEVPMHWEIQAGDGTTIKHVILFGKYQQTAEGDVSPSSIRVYSFENETGDRIWKKLYNAKYGDGWGDSMLRESLFNIFRIHPSEVLLSCPGGRCAIGDRQ